MKISEIKSVPPKIAAVFISILYSFITDVFVVVLSKLEDDELRWLNGIIAFSSLTLVKLLEMIIFTVSNFSHAFGAFITFFPIKGQLGEDSNNSVQKSICSIIAP